MIAVFQHPRIAWLVGVLAGFGAGSASAVILYGLDNGANQADPGTGVPWPSVALVSDAGGANPSGSAIHLGDGYMLTANHVGMKSSVTFDGATYYTRDLGFAPVQVAAGVDMKVFRLTSTPTVGAVELYAGGGDDLGDSVQVGWGVGRDGTVPVATAAVAWGDATTVAKRWGVNAVLQADTIAYDSYSFDGLTTALGETAGDPSGLGDSESGSTLYDSGSGLFREIGGSWFLTGLTTAVETYGTSTFGDDELDGEGRGDQNAFVQISSYRDDVLVLIPEPSIWLCVIVGLFPCVMRRKVTRD